MQLYSFFRSSAAYRVRIALNVKGLPFETVPIHLTKDGGRQHSPAFHAVNPQERVPALALRGARFGPKPARNRARRPRRA